MSDMQDSVFERLRESERAYTSQSALASETARKVAFGAAAICWFFRRPDASFPIAIICSMLFLAAYFVCDLLQHLIAVWDYKRLYKHISAYGYEHRPALTENDGQDERELNRKIAGVGNYAEWFFWAKFVALLCGWFAIVIELILQSV